MQESRTGDPVHGVGRIVSYISDTVTFLPGDVIATCTRRSGDGREPSVLLRPGDDRDGPGRRSPTKTPNGAATSTAR